MDAMNPAARSLYLLLWLVGRLPLRALHAVGHAIAFTVQLFGRRELGVIRRNLALAFPSLAADARETLVRETLRHTGATLAETCRFFTTSATRNLVLVREVIGQEHLDAAQASGRGVIVAAPHLGNWELLNQFLASRAPITIVYRAPRQAWIEALLLRARGHAAVTQVRAEASGVRVLLRCLQRGGTVGILPDQQPKRGEGEFAPFFGVAALTMTLLPRLAQRAHAIVLFAWAERLPRSAGFRIHIEPALPALHDADAPAAVAALNAGVERCVRMAPSQYQWGYKRYSIRPAPDGITYR
jgi:KDO2-lipid IV(A) lauroyltransferase